MSAETAAVAVWLPMEKISRVTKIENVLGAERRRWAPITTARSTGLATLSEKPDDWLVLQARPSRGLRC